MERRIDQVRSILLKLARPPLEAVAWIDGEGLLRFSMRADADLECVSRMLACNLADIRRYLEADQDLENEPAWKFPDPERNGCLDACFLGLPECVCAGTCFSPERTCDFSLPEEGICALCMGKLPEDAEYPAPFLENLDARQKNLLLKTLRPQEEREPQDGFFGDDSRAAGSPGPAKKYFRKD